MQCIKKTFCDIARDYRSSVTNKMGEWTETFNKVYRPADNSAPDYFSLAGWKERARQVHDLVIEHKTLSDTQRERLSKIYTGDALKQQTANIEQEHREMLNVARQLIEDDFKFVLDEKRMQHAAAVGAPTDEQVRLLTALNMRTSVNQDEFNSAINACNGSLTAMRVLRDIARKNGAMFPHLPSEQDFQKAVGQMEDVCKLAVDDVSIPTDEMGYFSRLFWASDSWGANGEAAEAIDRPVYLTVDEPAANERAAQRAQEKAQERAALKAEYNDALTENAALRAQQGAAQDGHIRVRNDATGY